MLAWTREFYIPHPVVWVAINTAVKIAAPLSRGDLGAFLRGGDFTKHLDNIGDKMVTGLS